MVPPTTTLSTSTSIDIPIDVKENEEPTVAHVAKLKTRSISEISKNSKISKTRFSDNGDDNPRSWWYAFCLKCRSKESTPETWEPKYWSNLFPYPFFPDYRDISRFISLVLIVVSAWVILYTIVGPISAPPNGQLFQLLFLVLGSKFGGWIISLIDLPGLIGMLFTGILMQNINLVNIDESFYPITKQLRKIALVVILIRAGLDLDPVALRRLKCSVFKLGLVPWLIEVICITVMSKYLLDISWEYGFALGSIVSAVSPAVTVPCLLRLRVKGYGVAKGIPTLIIAIAGIDDATSVALFGILKSTIFSTSSVINIILEAPLSIIGGIVFGIIWGVLCYFVPEKNDSHIVPLRVSMLFLGCLLAVFGSEAIDYGGAGPLGCVIAAFTALLMWSKHGWNIEDNPASSAFEVCWMFFEPILFGITGAQIKLNELDKETMLIGLGILVASTIVRIGATVALGIGCGLNLKEKVFSAFALMSKATVQAALGPVLLGLITDKKSVEYVYSEKILMLCVLSIILTAPTSAVLMTILGPYFLKRTTDTFNVENIRASRMSIRSLKSFTVENGENLENGETTQKTG